jgi:hypothetical protein
VQHAWLGWKEEWGEGGIQEEGEEGGGEREKKSQQQQQQQELEEEEEEEDGGGGEEEEEWGGWGGGVSADVYSIMTDTEWSEAVQVHTHGRSVEEDEASGAQPRGIMSEAGSDRAKELLDIKSHWRHWAPGVSCSRAPQVWRKLAYHTLHTHLHTRSYTRAHAHTRKQLSPSGRLLCLILITSLVSF